MMPPRGTLSSHCCGGQAAFAQAGDSSQGSQARSARGGASGGKIETLFDVVRWQHDC